MIQDSWQSSLNKATLPTDLQATWIERGVRKNDGVQQRLEQIGRSLMKGYYVSKSSHDPAEIESQLDLIDAELCGFAFEGVGMGLTQRDLMTSGQHGYLERCVSTGSGATYANMVYVGLGLMLARIGQPLTPHLVKLDAPRAWLAIDGYGYYQGMFDWKNSFERYLVPKSVPDDALHVFDQGLGRSIWFVDGGDVERISRTIAAFPFPRQADLWGGVGYACAYAGGAEPSTLEDLIQTAGGYREQVAQGTAFAAKSRQRIGNPSPYTERACQVFWGMDTASVAQKIDQPLAERPVWQHYRANVPHPVSRPLPV